MVVDQEAVWKTVADTAFNGVNHCVAGSYPSKTKRSDGIRRKHGIRKDVDIQDHYRAISEVWTGKGGKKLDGDAFMIP